MRRAAGSVALATTVLLAEPEFLLILQQAKPRRGTETVINGECVLLL